jgi:hypothetical protein
MSGELSLFLVLCFIYITDCFVWVEQHSVVFVTWDGKRWIEKAANQLFQIFKKGLLLLNPLPSIGTAIYCHLPPLSIAPMGICSLNCQIFTHKGVSEPNIIAIPFEEISSIKVHNKDLIINESQFCRFGHKRQADRVNLLLHSMNDANLQERTFIIKKFLREQFDYRETKRRFEQLTIEIRYLRFLCSMFFFLLFAFSPLLVYYFGLNKMFLPITLGMFAFAIQISIVFYMLHKSFYLNDNEERTNGLMMMILFPPAAIRASNIITQNLLIERNPIVISHILFSNDKFKEFASRTLRNLKYPPIGHSIERHENEIISWHNQTLLSIVSKYITDVANLKDELLIPPPPDDSTVRAYCPRCLSQFMQEEGDCPDCPGVSLLPLYRALPITASKE